MALETYRNLKRCEYSLGETIKTMNQITVIKKTVRKNELPSHSTPVDLTEDFSKREVVKNIKSWIADWRERQKVESKNLGGFGQGQLNQKTKSLNFG